MTAWPHRAQAANSRSMYGLDTARLEALPSDERLQNRVKKIAVKLDEGHEGEAVLRFTVWVDLTGVKPMSPAARELFEAVREEMRKRVTGEAGYEVRPYVHFLSAAA